MATAAHVFTLGELVDTVGNNEHVLKIFAAQQGRFVCVWTVVDSFDRAIRDQIYSAERTVFQNFPDFRFDFNVVEGDEKTTISDARLVYSKA